MAAHATSVIPPTFPTLVGEADVIARGAVTAVESRWVDGAKGPVIKTFVTFNVEKQLKGAPAATLTLEFLGGTVGQDSLRVSGMPEFKPGDHEVLFVRGNGVQFCPLVRFAHGRYRIRTDATTRRRYMARNDERPLESVDEVQNADGADLAPARHSTATALTPDDFENQVGAEVARQRR